jgi:hypothetical protein
MLALMVRLIHLDTSLWEDEVLTYWGAILPFREAVVHRSQFLYYVLAHVALKLEDSEVMLRLPSVVAGVAGVAALYGFARQMAGRRVAWLAAFILALSSNHVDKSQEARFYAFVMLANTLMVWSLWRAVSHDNWKAWLGFALAANLGIASQFTVVPYVVVLALAGAVWIWIVPAPELEGKRTRRILHLGLAALFGVAGMLLSISIRGTFPFMVTSASQARSDVADAAERMLGEATFVNAYLLRPEQYLEFLHIYVPRYGTWIGGAFLVVLLVGILALGKRSPLALWLIAAQIVLVPLPLFFLYVSHWYHERYFCGIYPYYPLAIAVGCVFLIEKSSGILARKSRPLVPDPERLRRGIVAVLLAIFVLGYAKISSTNLIHHYQAGRLHDWKSIVRYLAPQLAPGDIVAVASPAVHGTQHLPKDKQVFPPTHPSLEYYLSRELATLRPGRDAPSFREIHIAGAGSKHQIEALASPETTGNIFIVVLECREPDRAPHEDLEKLPTVELTRALGLELRKVVSQPIGKGHTNSGDRTRPQ